MKITLVVEKSRKSVQILKEVSILGRSGECDIVVPDMSVSRIHCSITQKDGAVKIEDLGSKNHTGVPGKILMEKGDGATVKHGDTIAIGNIEFIIQIDDQPLPKDNSPLSDTAIAAEMAKDNTDEDEIKLAPENTDKKSATEQQP